MSEFKAKQIQDSIQRFRDYAQDLITADMNTFADRLNVFVAFCQEDLVFQQIHKQLVVGEDVTAEEWYSERVQRMGHFAGSASLDFPSDVDRRISLQYKLVVAIHDRKIDFEVFLIKFFTVGANKKDLYIEAFCNAVVVPLYRELNYKLEEIENNLPESRNTSVDKNILQVISNTGTLIQQTAFGNSNIQVAQQTQIPDELLKLLMQLRTEINTVVDDPQEKKDAAEVVSVVDDELRKEPPKKYVIKILLASLPILGNIAAIVSDILAAL